MSVIFMAVASVLVCGLTAFAFASFAAVAIFAHPVVD
jgi:hypothetical protein